MNDYVPGEVGISVLKTMLEQVLLSLKSTKHSDKTPIKVPMNQVHLSSGEGVAIAPFDRYYLNVKNKYRPIHFMETLADALLS